jgi:hypothetical protein
MRIDVTVAVERSDELVSVPRRAGRELLRSGKFEANALERVGQRHGLSFRQRTIATPF